MRVPLVDAIAPEHLEIATEDAEALARRIRNAGAIFLGAAHAGSDRRLCRRARTTCCRPRARRASPPACGVLDFMKRTSILKCGPDQLRALAPAAIALGEAEGLDAHALVPCASIRVVRGARPPAAASDRCAAQSAPRVDARMTRDDESHRQRSNRLVAITLDENSIGRSNRDVEHERAAAIYDLLEENTFAPHGDDGRAVRAAPEHHRTTA